MKDEKKMWLIVGGIFTAFLIFIDAGYSSFGEMARWYKALISILHIVFALSWIGVMIYFEDPNYDYLRKVTIGLAIAISLMVGIHHAVIKEDQQVIIDSIENSTK